MQSISQILEKELTDLDWYGLVNGGSAPFVNARYEINNAIRNKSRTLRLGPDTVSRLDARDFIRLVSDLAFERAYKFDHLFNPGNKKLSLSFELGCVEFEIVFTPTPNQPGDVVVKSRLAYWHEDGISDEFKEWKCLTHMDVHNFFSNAEAHWSATRYNGFCKAFFSNFLNFRAFTRGSTKHCYYVTCTQVLLYVECARRLVSRNDVHPQWIVLAVLCHLWLSTQGEAYFSTIFAPRRSPLIGNNRYRRALDIIGHFQMVRDGGDPEEEEVAQDLYSWPLKTLDLH
jgi:hypothetical protein